MNSQSMSLSAKMFLSFIFAENKVRTLLSQYTHHPLTLRDLTTKTEILIGKRYKCKSYCEFISLSLCRSTFNKKQFYKILLTNNLENKK
jgi:hypothetical protein